MRCHICNSGLEVGKCIVCDKWVCFKKHADTLLFDLKVSSDCRYNIESDNLSFKFYCCIEGHSGKEIQKALQKKFRKIPNSLKYKKIEKKKDLKLL